MVVIFHFGLESLALVYEIFWHVSADFWPSINAMAFLQFMHVSTKNDPSNLDFPLDSNMYTASKKSSHPY